MLPVHASVELASESHLHDVLRLVREARAEAGDTTVGGEREDRVLEALTRDDVRVYVARFGPEAVGVVSAVAPRLSGLADTSGVWVDMLYVTREARRKGVARLLLSAVERQAAAAGVTQVAVLAPAHARETNRFLARLGFASRLAFRAIPTETLAVRLAPQGVQSRDRALQRRQLLLRARKRQVAAAAEQV